jgi:hypothetical protein
MKDTVSHYVPPHSPLTSTEPQVFSNNLTMPSQLSGLGQLAVFIQQRIRHVYRRQRSTALPSCTAKP